MERFGPVEDFLQFIHPEDRVLAAGDLRNVVNNPSDPVRSEYRARCADGQYRWVDSTMCNSLSEPEVMAVIVYQRDIHVTRTAEAERLEQAEELKKANSRLEEFAYLAAHDLREPLRAISLYTEILSRTTKMDDKSKQMSRFVLDGSARMFTLIEDLLSYARSGVPGPSRPVNLQQAAEQAIDSLAIVITASGATVTVDSLPVVSSNETNVVRLFQNLIENAVKYRRPEPVEIRISAEPRSPGWAIKIQDNGVGIAAEHYDRIFKPFVRLSNKSVRGSGLGLAVCKKVVEGMGGAISVESDVGIGSTFIFTLSGDERVSALGM